MRAPFKIPPIIAIEIPESIEPTLLMEMEEGYVFDWAAARSALISTHE